MDLTMTGPNRENKRKIVKYKIDDQVKSCKRLESGLRFGPEGLRACQFGAIASPVYWSGDEAGHLTITKEMIVAKRQWLFELLNDANSDIPCKRCDMVEVKRYQNVDFTQLGQIDLAAMTLCNLRCNFCGFTRNNEFRKAEYDALSILKVFTKEDVQWDSVVDFNGGEPVLLNDLDAYFDFFKAMRIRIRFMTNGVIYKQRVYDGLLDGTLQWVVTSVDAGTPSTYSKKKQRDYYVQVLENLMCYSHAGHQDGGRLAIKYIFCDDNCGDDDIVGFVYAMLAIKPHQVWLTFDFSRFGQSYSYTKEIIAYAKMWNMLKQNGAKPVHYSIGHLALIAEEGKDLLQAVIEEIKRQAPPSSADSFALRQYQQTASEVALQTIPLKNNPWRINTGGDEEESWSVKNKRILLTPPCFHSISLLSDPEMNRASVIGFLDRDPLVQGKKIQGIPIYGYDKIQQLDLDIIIVAAPAQHRHDIINQLSGHVDVATPVMVLQ